MKLHTKEPQTEEQQSILIIEDDDGIRESLKTLLELESLRVFSAANGLEGLETLKNMPRPCLILLDLMMPVMDGWEFVDHIATDLNYSEIPIVALTAFSGSKMIRVNEVVHKPVDIDTLCGVVKKYCH